MSDGREEREEQRKRIEQERQDRNRDDRIHPEHADEWEPERVDS